MTEIPMPEVLNPERIDALGEQGGSERHHRLVAEALYQACEYGRALWSELELTRRYLLQQVARGSEDGPVLAEQPLLRSEQDWATWAARYASIFSRLCGPQGDEDLGKREALHEAQAHHHLLP